MSDIFVRLGTLSLLILAVSCSYQPDPDIGLPAGLIPECPGITKNATISPKNLPKLQVVLHRVEASGMITRKGFPVVSAAKALAKDKLFDLKNRKTVIYACGFFDSSAYPSSLAIGSALSRRGYNVLITETLSFLTKIYPISVRIARTIGKKLGEMLVKLSSYGLQPENIELVGVSLGAHIVGFAAKHYYQVTGKKPFRIIGLDPAGPCFRNLPETMRLNPSDAERVDVLHTNIDGFGMANRMGHVDFYANGGEFQPGDIPFLPCLVICSHIRSIIYFWQALEHPKKFIGVKCDSVQDARLANCFNNTETNYFGMETDYMKPGVFYLPTNNVFPYYRGKDGLKQENEIFSSVARSINSEDSIIV